MKLVRSNLSQRAAEAVRHRILSGELEAGAPLREERLSEELGVSRTPLREALQGLVRDRLVDSLPGKGFSVRPLKAREVCEIYPLRALLESEALRLAGLPGAEHLEALRALNRRLRREPPGAGWIHLDDAWHDLLIRDCDNGHLCRFILQVRRLSLRYELAFLDVVGDPALSTEQHDAIVDALAAGELEPACRLLRDNMTVGMAPLLERLEESQ
jgi:DNA-binding GntR family transcriptional regulator